MGFGKSGNSYKPKAPKKMRGSLDAALIEIAIKDNWSDLCDHFDAEDDSVNNEMKGHFNEKFPGAGDALLEDDSDDFSGLLANLSVDEKMAIFDELFDQNVIDKESLFVEGE